MKIAIIGGGISGLVAAHLLHPKHDITLFEAAPYIGGHTHTVDVVLDHQSYAIDTGFIVYNERTYPGFTEILKRLDVPTQPSEMSFSVRDERSGLEYSGTSLNTLFAQRRNLLRPSHFRMIADILRFHREARELLVGDHSELTLGEFLDKKKYSKAFIEGHLIPMGAAIWSSGTLSIRDFPAQMFVRFFNNHGFLSVDDRPQWRVIQGGSSRYVEKLIEPFRDRIRSGCPIDTVIRSQSSETSNDRDLTSSGRRRLEVVPKDGEAELFDEVIFACHSNQALDLLQNPTAAEREVLSAIPYQANDVILHTDVSLMPRKRLAWAAWNYHRAKTETDRSTVTYNMNILQGLKASTQFLVTLNHVDAINPDKIIRQFNYTHPVFTREGMSAQARYGEISGVNNTHFCGAYWFNGFHEDGVRSALRVCEGLGETL